jgi:hypothetical protein
MLSGIRALDFERTIMKIRTAVVTAAGVGQGGLLLQHLVDHDGCEKTVFEMIIEEIDSIGID